MNKKELVSSVCKKLGNTSLAEGEKVLNAVLEAICEGIKNTGSVQVVGFGSFKSICRKAKKTLHPTTRDPIEIPETQTVRFSPGKTFREAIAQKNEDC